MGRVAKILAKGAEGIAVAMLAAMFLAFIVQIIFRYALNLPVGWTNEISSVLWIWLVLWGAAFVLREHEEIRFDLIYGGVGEGTRRIMCLVTAAGLVGLYLASLPAIYDYVSFMRVQRTAYMKIRFDWLYAIYVIFAVAAIARYLWLGFRALRGGAPDAFDPTKANSGV